MKRVKRTRKSGLFQSPLFSMAISLLLVAATVGFVFGFGAFLDNQTYTGPEVVSGLESTEEQKKSPEYLKMDSRFKACYVMICEVPPLGLWANPVPGEKTDASKMLVSGQIVHAKQRGSYKGQTYYKLDDGTYLSADITHAQPLISYTEMEGYLAITYISSSGVRLRKWADFDADNVAGAVYVGDKIQVKAKVQTEKGDSAFITTDGLYITADPQYFNDYSSVREKSTESGKKNKNSASTSEYSTKNGTTETDKTGETGRTTEADKTDETGRTTETDETDASERTTASDRTDDSGTTGSGDTTGTQNRNTGKWDFSDRELNSQE